MDGDNVFSTKNMTHDAAKKLFIGEASECQVGRNDDSLFLSPQSHITGIVTSWIEVKRDYSGGDLAGINYRPRGDEVLKHPKLKGYRLLIIND